VLVKNIFINLTCVFSFSADITSDAKESVRCYQGNQEVAKDQPAMDQSYDPEQNWRLDQSTVKQSRANEHINWQARQQSNMGTQSKPSSAAFGPGRPQMSHLEQKSSEMGPKQKKDISMAQRRPKPATLNVSKMRCEQVHSLLDAYNGTIGLKYFAVFIATICST
jgi:hypothetical protein